MSGGGRYRYLFSPLRIGPLTVRNRIVFSAHLTNYATDGEPSEQHAAYYAERAAGGVGLIITEEHSTHPTDWPYEKLIHGFHRSVIPGYRRITEAAHAHDVPILAQLNHNGGQASSMYSRLPVLAPSPVPDPMFREVPKGVEPHEIAEIVAGYGTVAGHCADGGFDGVELQCSHSSIVRGFLSPSTNKRTDSYGGSLENRMRILTEIIDAVREAIGRDRALGVRICGDELIEGGTTIDEAVRVARAVETTGKVDYINTSIGVATATLYMIEASMSIPPGYALFISNAIRRAVRLPIVGVGRIKDPRQAERALEEGHCDLVGVVRGQIADADFAAKARSGKATAIRTCLSCNQECVGRMGLNRWLGCIENPRAGREAELGSTRFSLAAPKKRPKSLLVVGGGPAGLQVASTAAQAGHDVTLLERSERTGGQVAEAARVPNRAEFLDVVRNLRNECNRYGVRLRTGVTADADSIRAKRPDVVVLATGARPQPPWWAEKNERVVDVRDVLRGTASPEGDVVVVDDLGFHQATSVAELLADRGASVEIITSGMVVGQDLGVTLDMEMFNVRAHAKGIRQSTDLVVMGTEESRSGGVSLNLLHHPTSSSLRRDYNWVVCATHQAPEDELWHQLSSDEFEIHRIGDCLAPRRAHAAVVEGHRVGAAL